MLDPVDERLVELDDLGAELQHVAEAGVARTGVVDGQVRAGGRPRLHGPAHRLVVEDDLGLAQLEDQAGHHLARHEVEHPGVEQHRRRQVHEQPRPSRWEPRGQRRLEAQQLELGPDAGGRGGRQPHVRPGLGQVLHAGQGLVPDDRAVAHRDDRLEHGLHRLLGEESDDVICRGARVLSR